MRAGPALPSYLALLHAGFSVPRMLPSGRWALTPPFHPCQMRSTVTGGSSALPRTRRRDQSSPAVYFLWHFPWPRGTGFDRSLAQPPGVTRRVARYPETPQGVQGESESGLSSRRPFACLLADLGPAGDHPAHPPKPLYRKILRGPSFDAFWRCLRGLRGRLCRIAPDVRAGGVLWRLRRGASSCRSPV